MRLVAFHVCDSPWELEKALIESVDLPLNLDQNRNHAFHAELTTCRRTAKLRAREHEIV